MRISELIRQLQITESECGDVDVDFIGTLPEDPDEDTLPIAGLGVSVDDLGEPLSVTICDDLTLDEFIRGGAI